MCGYVPASHPGNKPHSSVVGDLFRVLRGPVCSYFLEGFASMPIGDTGLLFSFPVVVSGCGLGKSWGVFSPLLVFENV